MKQIITLLIITTLALSQSEINLKSTNKNPFALKEAFKIMDNKDGFYDEIITRSAPNGTIYVYDKGNKLCFKFDKNGKHLLTFGKEGNGPGEFSQFVIDFYASNDRIIFKNFASQIVMFFTSEGKFIKDVKENKLVLSQPVVVGDNFEFHFPKNEFTEKVKAVYDKDGNELETVTNEGFVEGAMAAARANPDMKKNLQRPVSFMPFNNGFAQHYVGAYKVEFVNKAGEITKRFTTNYDRVKIKDLADLIPRAQKKFFDQAPAEQKKMFLQMMTSASKELGGFHPDIVDILGTHKNYLFIQTRAEDNDVLKIHVISDKDELVQEITLKCDEITSAKVTNGLLLVNQTNDEVGPYASVYRL